MKQYLKNIILGLVATIVLIVVGCVTLNTQHQVQDKNSSYTRTTFDYVLSSPSDEQVVEIANNSEVVAVFPCYNFKIKLTGNASKEINVLFSDKMEQFETGLFNENIIIEGKYDENGLMIDKYAADELKVGIGDEVSFVLRGQQFKLNIAGIYVTSTYKNLDKGLAIAKWTNAMNDVFEKEIAYNLMFVDLLDESKGEVLFADYKPMGQLISQEQYVKDYKAENTLPPMMSEDEWNQAIINAYNELRDNFLAGAHLGAVQRKADFKMDALDQTATTESNTKLVQIVTGIAVAVVYTLMSVVIVLVDKKHNKNKIKDGTSANEVVKKSIFVNAGITLATSILSLIAIIICGATGSVVGYAGVACIIALPVLAAAIIMPIVIRFVYKGCLEDRA